MDITLFVFFVLPLATILLAIVLQRILRSPILVAITFFAIYLIVAFVSFADTLAEAIIAVIVYTIIAYITAYIVMLICRCRKRFYGGRLIDKNNVVNDTVNLLGTTQDTGSQYVNNATMYGNVTRDRNNIQRRCYRRI